MALWGSFLFALWSGAFSHFENTLPKWFKYR